MPKQSAGLLMFRRGDGGPEVLLVHPGGPFWAKKDLGAWSIPKGEYLENEAAIDAARREFTEETGFPISGDLLPLGEVKQSGGKLVFAWAFDGNADPSALASSSYCTLEWPPRSGRTIKFPEVDRCAWFTIAEARSHILKGQSPFLDTLVNLLALKLNQQPS
jgi:predicted NUDIX family NTP pyrophosphohydrolase